MTDKLNCKQLSTKINFLKSRKSDFDKEIKNGDIAICLMIKSVLLKLIKEIKDSYWTLEILTTENLGKQYEEWEKMYQDLNPEYSLPSLERILDFLRDDPEFQELLRIKEKQGLTKLIIAPAPGFYPLKDFADRIGQKITANGGNDNYYDPRSWKKMIEETDEIRYFSRIITSPGNRSKAVEGVTIKELKSHPDKYSICDGWIISFTTHEQNIAKNDEQRDTGNGRVAIKTELSAKRYQEYFSDDIEMYAKGYQEYISEDKEMYIGEKCMIPQEYFSLFAKDFYEKYIKDNKKLIFVKSSDLMDSTTLTAFTSIRLAEEDNTYPYFPFVGWNTNTRHLACNYYSLGTIDKDLGVRSVVRRNIKS